MMKIYLDSSALNRIFDDQAQPRIYLEASAMLIIFELIEREQLSLVSSIALDYELSHNPYNERHSFVTAILSNAHSHQDTEPAVVKRGRQLEALGIKALDALHISCAEALVVDAFITCDDKLLKSSFPKIPVIAPPQFVVNLSQGENENGNS